MYLLIVFIIITVISLVLYKVYQIKKEPIKFFLEGIDSGFGIGEILLLWKTTKATGVSEPISVYWSMPVLTQCIAHIKSEADFSGAIDAVKTQKLLSKLYDFRTKIEKDADKKRGLDSTRALDEGQKLRIILPGKGVFSSEIVNNARDLTIKVPTQKDIITISGADWVGKTISVYLWRKGDARYVFDTTVNGEGLFLGKPSLFLQHSNNLLRTQKRNAIRAKCKINATLFLIKDKVIDYNVIETKGGFRCLLEDISEKGALIRIGGKGIPNLQLKIQFQIDNRLVVMFGIVRTVEYNEELGQSRLHFECIHIEEAMKNIVLSYVYNILPESEREIYDAIKLTTVDEEAAPAEESEENDKNDSSNNKEEEKKDSSDMMFETKTEYEDVEDLEPMEEIPMEEKLEELTLEDALPVESPIDSDPETIEKGKKKSKSKK